MTNQVCKRSDFKLKYKFSFKALLGIFSPIRITRTMKQAIKADLQHNNFISSAVSMQCIVK